MSSGSSPEITRMLVAWNEGDPSALDKLAPLVHSELRRLARHYMAGERAGHTLQTTALVNEAYLRLFEWQPSQWRNRAHFFGTVAQLMRRILVDHARGRDARKRDEGIRVSIGQADRVASGRSVDFLALDDALRSLAELDPRKSRIVELRFFGGLGVEETAEVMELSPRTILREWNLAQAWLYRELSTRFH